MWSFSKLSAHIFTEDGNFRHRHDSIHLTIRGRRNLGTNHPRRPRVDPGAVSRVGRKARRKFPSRLFSRWVRTGMTSTALGIVREACNFWYSTKLCRNTYIPRLVISWYIVKLNSLIPIVSIKWDFQFRDPPWSTFSCFRFNTRLLNTGTLTQVFKFKCELLSSLHYINAGRNLEFIYTGIFFSFFFLLWDGKRLRHLHATRCS